MTDYPGTYRARCVSVKDDKITAYVPQVFGDKRITITSRTGGLPDPNSNGWVMFESAQASLPVWQSASGGQVSGSTTTVITDPDVIYWTSPGIFFLPYGVFVGGPSTTPLPDSWVGYQVRTSLLMLTTNWSAAQVHYTGTMEDPENPGSYITPPDETVPWLPTSQYNLPTASFSLVPDQAPPEDMILGNIEDMPNYLVVPVRHDDLVDNSVHWLPINTITHNGSIHATVLEPSLGTGFELVNPPVVTYPDVEHTIQTFVIPTGTIRYERL